LEKVEDVRVRAPTVGINVNSPFVIPLQTKFRCTADNVVSPIMDTLIFDNEVLLNKKLCTPDMKVAEPWTVNPFELAVVLAYTFDPAEEIVLPLEVIVTSLKTLSNVNA